MNFLLKRSCFLLLNSIGLITISTPPFFAAEARSLSPEEVIRQIQTNRVKAVEQKSREFKSERPAAVPDPDGSKVNLVPHSTAGLTLKEVKEKEKNHTDKDDQKTPDAERKNLPKERIVAAPESKALASSKGKNPSPLLKPGTLSSEEPAKPGAPDYSKSTATPGFGGPSIEFPKK